MIEAVLPSLPGEEVRIITHMPEKGEKEEAWMLLEIKTMGSFILLPLPIGGRKRLVSIRCRLRKGGLHRRGNRSGIKEARGCV